MGKKVKVTTQCGETFYYDHEQEVETVEIVEKTYSRKEKVGTWMIYYFDERFIVVNRDEDYKYEFVDGSNGWINAGKYQKVHENDLTEGLL